MIEEKVNPRLVFLFFGENTAASHHLSRVAPSGLGHLQFCMVSGIGSKVL